MRKLWVSFGTVALVSAALLVGAQATSAKKNDDTGHTPVVVCHWVPAGPGGAHDQAAPNGGSYVVIVVDDDGANGNKNLKGHEGHELDVIGEGTDCFHRE